MFLRLGKVSPWPHALLIGVLIAFTARFRIWGPFIGWAVGAFPLSVDHFPMDALPFSGIFHFQQIEGIWSSPCRHSVGLPSGVLVAVPGWQHDGVVGGWFYSQFVLYTLLRDTVNGTVKRRKLSVCQMICKRDSAENCVRYKRLATVHKHWYRMSFCKYSALLLKKWYLYWNKSSKYI